MCTKPPFLEDNCASAEESKVRRSPASGAQGTNSINPVVFKLDILGIHSIVSTAVVSGKIHITPEPSSSNNMGPG